MKEKLPDEVIVITKDNTAADIIDIIGKAKLEGKDFIIILDDHFTPTREIATIVEPHMLDMSDLYIEEDPSIDRGKESRANAVRHHKQKRPRITKPKQNFNIRNKSRRS